MKRKYHRAIIGVYILIVLAGVVWHAGGASAEDTIKLTVNSHTTSMAKMNNMQPGDVTSSDYTVINEGNEPFNYYVDFKFMSGDKELYNILQMTLQKEGVILYSGVMSEAEGRVAVGTLSGGAQEAIQMDVTFPYEAGNEYQAKTTSVAFIFSASGEPNPSATPSATPSASATPNPSAASSATPSASATPNPSAAPSATPSASATPNPSAAPSATPSASATPNPSAAPSATPSASATPNPTDGPTAAPTASSVPGTIVTPAASSAATASPGLNEATVTDPPVPLGGNNSSSGSPPSASPGTGNTGTGNEATSSPDPGVTLGDDELPLGGPDGGGKLPDTAEPWYNLILISLAVAIVSIIILRRLSSKK
ncbi:hypothetical protein A3844_30745 [Paenibacillus helianthi]|uniref:LPXTG cell wall anchor domain-containing protein n=1 Tax=Paenibacillus helianthi TaxID=1349432 RepID=A0ABX3EGC7_9BACL|nr:hypothetical protein [Paenibacillus helianthi]OKP76648.1 hypothetical protein A3844_30745 [Paenibacillus helianthi]